MSVVERVPLLVKENVRELVKVVLWDNVKVSYVGVSENEDVTENVVEALAVSVTESVSSVTDSVSVPETVSVPDCVLVELRESVPVGVSVMGTVSVSVGIKVRLRE